MELLRCEAGHGDLDLARGYLLSVNFPVTEIRNKVNNVKSELEEVSSNSQLSVQSNFTKSRQKLRHSTSLLSDIQT